MALMRNLIDRYGEEEQAHQDPKVAVSRALIIYRLTQADGECATIEAMPRLSIGSAGAAYNEAGLRFKGITHILCLCSTLRLNYPDKFIYRRVSLEDNGNDPSQLAQLLPPCHEFIDEALSSSSSAIVLVHCFQGKSRSAAVCISYLMSKLGMTYVLALHSLRQTRPLAEPNTYFAAQLQSQ